MFNNSISDEIISTYEKYTKEYPDVINSSNGKDIGVLCGNTGVGKTTLANFLAVCEMEVVGATKNIYGNYEGGVIKLKNPNDPKAMKISTSYKSETILPNKVNINNIELYDLAGLGDNRGSAILILNTYIIKNIIENAKSVRLIFVTSPAEFDSERGKAFKNIWRVAENAFSKSIIQTSSCLVINKSTKYELKDEIQELILKAEPGTISLWSNSNKIARMCIPIGLNFRSQERNEIINLISSLDGQKITLNAGKLFSPYEESVIQNICQAQMEKVYYDILNQYNNENLRKLNLNQLNQTKNELQSQFDAKLEQEIQKNKLLVIVSSLANDLLKNSINSLKKLGKKGEILLHIENLIYKKQQERKQFIRSIMVIYSFSTSSNCVVPQGYQKIDVDLNWGCGGWFLYLCYSREERFGKPISGLTSINNGRRGVATYYGPGYEAVMSNEGGVANTNRSLGKKGDDISLFFSRSNNPDYGMTDLWVGGFDGPTDYCPPGYVRLNQDLSQGAGGKYIYVASKYTSI